MLSVLVNALDSRKDHRMTESVPRTARERARLEITTEIV